MELFRLQMTAWTQEHAQELMLQFSNYQHLHQVIKELTSGFLQLTSLHSSKDPSNIQLSQTSKL